MKSLVFLLFALLAPSLAHAQCSPCPATHCLSRVAGQGCEPVGSCNSSPPFCDAGGGGGGGQTSSVMVNIDVSASPTFTLTMSPNPAGPLSCTAAPGTVVSTATTTGGDGNAATLAITGDTASFTLSGQHVIVGSSGIAAGDCGKSDTVTVTATQP
jgi:hypothetical protein